MGHILCLSAILISSLLVACDPSETSDKREPPEPGSGSAATDTGLGQATAGGSDGGGGTGDTDADTGPVPAALDCAFSDSRVDSDWDAPASTGITAIGTWSDGRSQDVTLDAQWELTAGPGGRIASGTYTAPPRGAGPVTATVTWEGLSAECSIETFLEAVIDLTGDAAIETAVGASTPRLEADCAPFVLYPLDGSLIPADFFSPEVQWLGDDGQDIFVVTFETTYITLRAITTATAWTPDGDAWWAVADPDSGTRIDMTVLGGTWDGTTGTLTDGLCGSPWATALQTAWWGAQGAVFYWTPQAEGLWQVDVGAETAEPWMDRSTTGQCVGCHSVNLSNPGLLTVAVGSGGYGASTVADDADPLTTLAGGGRTQSFSALDPTGTRMVRTAYGSLYLDDLITDVNIGLVPTTGYASHPTWSPDGRWVAYSSCAGASNADDWLVADCDLRMLEVLPGDTWGPDTLLAAAPPGHNYYYPTFAPDSSWVAFTRNTSSADAYAEPTAELMLMPRTGGPPMVLATANGLPNVTNSWPRWGPIVGDIGWLAYSSRRPYALQTSETAQIWVAGVNLAEAAAGRDGSFAPVWLPGQSTATGNHTPAFVQRQTD
ncbi:MAG: hypothetical protein VX265_11940 [Myxococcota bacterium]|nr:hypothetical protein [Myxococcota bacterium]